MRRTLTCAPPMALKLFNTLTRSSREFALLLMIVSAPVLAADAPTQNEGEPPAWAYPVNPLDFKPATDDGKLKHVPNSTATYSLGQLRDLFMAPDWHSEDHAPMPDVVMHGRKPSVYAIGPMDRAAPKIRASPASLQLISSSRWPISRAVSGKLLCRKDFHRN